MSTARVLPSESIQKEFEKDPLKLLEEIRTEENSSENFEEEKTEPEIIFKPEKNPHATDVIDNINILNSQINNLTCKNDFIPCNPDIVSNDTGNKAINSFLKFFNFYSKEEGKSDEHITVFNSHCSNNDVSINSFNQNLNNEQTCNDNNSNTLLDNSYKNNPSKNVNNNHFNISKILSNLKTYKGSIYAQSLLESIEKENELSSFFNELIPNLCQIMCSEYGNYFFQKLLKKLSLNQRLNIYKIIQPEFLVIASNRWGTHSIQSLMGNIQTNEEYYELNLLISQNMLLLFTDDNAYHIMMKMILDFPEEQRFVLNFYLVTNIDKIITSNNGAFCVNKFIVNNKNLKLRMILLQNLKNNLKKLIKNKYCCINLLLIIQTFGVEWGTFILQEIQNNYISLIENPVSRIFILKVLEFLKNNNSILLKELLWPLYRNVNVINYISNNKGLKKFWKQLIELSDNEQKVYLYILLKRSNW